MALFLLLEVFEDSVVSGNALVFGNPLVPGSSPWAFGNPLLLENLSVSGDSLASVNVLGWLLVYVNNYEHAIDSSLVSQARLVTLVLDSVASATQHDAVEPGECSN